MLADCDKFLNLIMILAVISNSAILGMRIFQGSPMLTLLSISSNRSDNPFVSVITYANFPIIIRHCFIDK